MARPPVTAAAATAPITVPRWRQRVRRQSRLLVQSNSRPLLDKCCDLACAGALVGFALCSSPLAADAAAVLELSTLKAEKVSCGAKFNPKGNQCFRISAEAFNKYPEELYSVIVRGQVVGADKQLTTDAQGFSSMPKVGVQLQEAVPSGSASIAFDIAVNVQQAESGPLLLKKFTATGFRGQAGGISKQLDFFVEDESRIQ